MKRTLTGEHIDQSELDDKRCGFLLNFVKMIGILLFTILFTEMMYRIHMGTHSLILVFILSVIVVSRVTPGYMYGIMAAVISTFAYDFLFTVPRLGFSFTIGSPITLGTMLLVTFITSALTNQVKNQAQLALDREHRVQLLYEINQKLLAAGNLDAIVKLTNEYLISHLQRPVIFYTNDPRLFGESSHAQAPGDSNDTDVFYSEAEQKRVHRIFHSGVTEPVELMEDPEHGVYYLPAISKEKVLGVIGISCREKALSHGNFIFVHMLIGQVAFAMELHRISDKQRHTLVEAEKEKMRSTLLRSISHDLRTPLTSILGASSTILEQKDMAGQTHENLVKDINENAKWLIRMVENILTITKISHDTMKVNKTPEAAEEVVAQTVSIVRKRFPDCHIHVRIPEELLMVPMDATLISQVIINLLENAIKNSPSGSLILMDLTKQDDFAQFSVSDNGKGIHEQFLDDLFEMHCAYSEKGREQGIDSTRGIGIGLSICRTIIQAHGGSIQGYNRKEGGAKFSFQLPLQEERGE